MRGIAPIVAAMAVGIAGCTPDPITLNFRFPTEEHFLYTSTGNIDIFDLEADQRGVCATLVNLAINKQPYTNPLPSLQSGSVDVCDLRDGGYMFEDIGAANRAFVVTMMDDIGQVLMYGCIESATNVDVTEPIDITLTPTTDYSIRIEQYISRNGELECSDSNQKCSRGCR